LNETLFAHSDEFKEEIEGDAVSSSFNDIDDQVYILKIGTTHDFKK
jgi:hypothetical protein